MIEFSENECCGCEACVQICPTNCISFSLGAKGFFYPKVDSERCVRCHKCERVCPYYHRSISTQLNQFAAFSDDLSLRMKSSSGGIFSLLSAKILNKGGVVFGASFDESFRVIHSYIESDNELYKLQGSKYVQSRIGNSFVLVRKYLEDSYPVLFSGTPCQVSALQLFLGHDYPNLVTVEVFCHGVPCPMIWDDYLRSLIGNKRCKSVFFRDKTRYGWRDYSYRVETEDNSIIYLPYGENVYSDGFLSDLTIRPSCFNCPSKIDNSRADISIGDYWGVDNIHKEIDDNLGCSAVIIHSQKGQFLFDSISCIKIQTRLEDIIKGNPLIANSALKPDNYDSFWEIYHIKGIKAIPISLGKNVSLYRKVFNKTYSAIRFLKKCLFSQ